MTLNSLSNFESFLPQLLNNVPKSKKRKVDKLIVEIDKLIRIEEKSNPSDLFIDFLKDKIPVFKLYDQANRNLKETYKIEDLQNPPAALRNLCSVAKFNFSKYYEDITIGDSGEAETALLNANANLKSTFNRHWNQDDVYPRLRHEGDDIKILIRAADKFNEIQDRSQGMRQFITLLAFALNHDNNRDLVLLIDEAELHLHYDAQIDLIKLFEEQKLVNSIYYTTHSAGCLPSDLGTGIRAVKQIKDKKGNLKHSTIRNSVWQNDAGFSPILMAMGASLWSNPLLIGQFSGD